MAVRPLTKDDDRLRKAIMRGIIRATEGVKNEAISLIRNTQKTGRVYHRRGVTHQASAPGEPPAIDRGILVRNIDTVYDFAQLSGKVVVRDPKAPHLEYGTQRMEPRPFLRPALAIKGGEAPRLIKEEIEKEFGK